jgi:hypothetical protein
MAETALTVSPLASDIYMPAFALEQATERRRLFRQFVARELKPEIDYGSSGMGKLPSLKKPGAEKLSTFFGLTPRFAILDQITDWTGSEHGGSPLFSYTYECTIWRNDVYLAQASANCNSWEAKYRWRWVTQDQLPRSMATDDLLRRDAAIEEFQFALEKKETQGAYGKPAEYWQMFAEAIANGRAEQITKETKGGKRYPAWRIAGTQFRIPNPDPYDAVNTCLKIAHKRSFVAGILIGVNASDYFTQDLEDDDHNPAPPEPYDSPETRRQTAPLRPQPVPQQSSEPEVPAPLQELWKRMAGASREGRLAEFAALKRGLIEQSGEEEGRRRYYAIIFGLHHVEHASQFQSLAKARQAAADLWWALQTEPGASDDGN